MEAETLSGKKLIFPKATKGKHTFILVAFKRQTQGELDSWLDPFIEEFGSRDSVTFYEIPMISKNWKWMSTWIDSGMRAGVPEFKHDHVATYYGSLTKYFDHFHVDDIGNVYVFFLDKEGNMIFNTSGPADEQKFGELRRTVNERTGE
ncbi:MAG: hypothetical protein ACOCTU_02990 [Bacteroidota bacterium]